MKSNMKNEFVEIAFDLNQIHHDLQKMNRALEKKFGLSLVQWSLLKSLIDRPAASPLILAQTLKITPGSLSSSLNRLENKKYLFTNVDPADARKKMISITRLGKQAVDAAEIKFKQIFPELLAIKPSLLQIKNHFNHFNNE